MNQRVISILLCVSIMLPAVSSASVITVVPILSVSAEITSIISDDPGNVWASATAQANVDTVDFGFQLRQSGIISVGLSAGSLSPGPVPASYFTYQVTVEFGGGVGAFSFEDDFSIAATGLPFPGPSNFLIYTSPNPYFFDFGNSGVATLGPPGAFSIFFGFGSHPGGTPAGFGGVPYDMFVSQLDSIPLPPAVWLLGGGLLVLFGQRRLAVARS